MTPTEDPASSAVRAIARRALPSAHADRVDEASSSTAGPEANAALGTLLARVFVDIDENSQSGEACCTSEACRRVAAAVATALLNAAHTHFVTANAAASRGAQERSEGLVQLHGVSSADQPGIEPTSLFASQTNFLAESLGIAGPASVVVAAKAASPCIFRTSMSSLPSQMYPHQPHPPQHRSQQPHHRRVSAAAALMVAKRKGSFFSLGLPTPTGSHSRSMTPTRLTRGARVTAADAFDGSYSVNQYVVLQTLGHGAQGEVYLAFDDTTSEFRAIKGIRRPAGTMAAAMSRPSGRASVSLGAAEASWSPTNVAVHAGLPVGLARDRQRRARLAREVAIMKRCRHANIVRLYEVIDDPSHDRMYLVMQYVEHGPLARLRPDGSVETPAQLPPPETTLGGPISPVDLAHYADQMVSGLQYLHRRGILHRDLKPDNILLGAHDTVYLSDFGLSTIVSDHEGTASPERARLAGGGTTAFMAPELLDPEAFGESPNVGPTVTPAADVWALGVTLYVLLYGKLPWQTAGRRLAATVDAITHGEIQFPERQPAPAVLLPAPRERNAPETEGGADDADIQSARSAGSPVLPAPPLVLHTPAPFSRERRGEDAEDDDAAGCGDAPDVQSADSRGTSPVCLSVPTRSPALLATATAAYSKPNAPLSPPAHGTPPVLLHTPAPFSRERQEDAEDDAAEESHPAPTAVAPGRVVAAFSSDASTSSSSACEMPPPAVESGDATGPPPAVGLPTAAETAAVEWASLLRRVLVREPKLRPTIDDVAAAVTRLRAAVEAAAPATDSDDESGIDGLLLSNDEAAGDDNDRGFGTLANVAPHSE